MSVSVTPREGFMQTKVFDCEEEQVSLVLLSESLPYGDVVVIGE